MPEQTTISDRERLLEKALAVLNPISDFLREDLDEPAERYLESLREEIRDALQTTVDRVAKAIWEAMSSLETPRAWDLLAPIKQEQMREVARAAIRAV